jgi:hypothetical protein
VGAVKPVRPVALVCAVMYREGKDCERALARLTGCFGPIAATHEPYPFTQTDYYEKEMGAPLYKRLVAFERLVQPDELASDKLITNFIEADLSTGGRRAVNLDPGYLDAARLVLASTKDHAHRILLERGIYGEITLLYRDGSFQPLPWTYPDYREEGTLTFLRGVRVWYLKEVGGTTTREA